MGPVVVLAVLGLAVPVVVMRYAEGPGRVTWQVGLRYWLMCALGVLVCVGWAWDPLVGDLCRKGMVVAVGFCVGLVVVLVDEVFATN